jgi:hypothetical protein
MVGLDPADIELIIQSGANVLLCGAEDAIQSALSFLVPQLRAPVHVVSAASGKLPTLSDGTVLLEDCEHWRFEQQQQLMDWLDAITPGVQIITTSDWPLFARVERGDFLPVLYYRLNTIHVDLYSTA